MKTPLRYPGGKSRAVKHILPHIPEDIERLVSPFFGGGSLELAIAARGTEVRGYDKMKQLVWFWQALCGDNNKLADEVQNLRTEYWIEEKGEFADDAPLRKLWLQENGADKLVEGCNKECFTNFREQLKDPSFMFSYEKAAKYYAINRASFSGATFSGGWSKRASYARFTPSSIQRLRDFKAKNFRVDYADFEDAMDYHPKAFLYLDPPYMLPTDQNALYGTNGDLHRSFDHEKLYSLLTKRTGWVMSYNKCPTIEKMYKGYKIIDAEWAYGMKNQKTRETTKKMGKSSEILIIG